ncbi:MAG: CHAD domain-containing protein [Methanomicrobiaceae archaeon]|nr:CHAD domain-containing protein [Methanomicrobiaceae archaeon]
MSIPEAEKDSGYCLYGARNLLDLLGALGGEIEGVREAEDIEYVHRMRVATRRIRATLPLYRNCFSKKQYRFWRLEIRNITRALGDARDADVQVDFLHKYLAALSPQETRSGTPLFALEGAAGGEGTGTEPLPAVYGEPVEGVPAQGPRTLRDHIRIFVTGTRMRIKRFREKSTRSRDQPQETGMAIPSIPRGSSQIYRPGLECIILRLQQKRNALQPGVISAIDRFVDLDVAGEMEGSLRRVVVEAKLRHTDMHSRTAYEQAFFNISLALEDVFSYERFVPQEERIEKHHAMRIAAKRLRYTMESFSDLYDGQMKAHIKAIKHLQDILGEMHDCDVWVDFLPEFLGEEKGRSVEYFGHAEFFRLIEPGVNHLREDRKARREALWRSLVEYWEQLRKEGYRDDLRSTISNPLQGLYQGDIVRIMEDGADRPLKVALIGDVHANLPALESVLDDARNRGATVILNIGDFVGFGAFPEEVVQRLRREHAISTIGNLDERVMNVKRSKKKRKNRQKYRALRWQYKRLSRESRAYLTSLPAEIRLNLKGKRIYMTHGSPESVTEYISPETPGSRLREFMEIAKADFIVSGHAHRPFAREVDGLWFINTGSVGRPEDGDPRACYALLQLNPFALYHFRVPYEINRSIEAIYGHRESGTFARIYHEGQPLDIIKHHEEEDQ